MNRKIDLPKHCHPLDKEIFKKGDPNCDHDYPPKSKDTSRGICVHLTCSKCGCEVCFAVLE